MSRPRPLLVATALAWARLERNAKRGWSAVAADQARRLDEALAAARLAPFWADHLGPHRALRDIADLAELPTVDKDGLRAAGESERLTAAPPPGTRVQRTSGSTGEPVRVLYGPRGAWFQGVLVLRTARHRGLRRWSRSAVVSVLPRERGSSGLVGVMRASREITVPADLGRDELLDRIRRGRPEWLSGHSQVLIQVGDALDGAVRPKAVLTNGDTLTPDSRATLQRLFGVPPLDSYGTAECGSVAWQCGAADLYHVNHEAVVVELVDDELRPAPPGDTGHVLLTSLWNPLMPFVRYRIGDDAAWATRPCRCGSALPALTHISGRAYDWVIDASGARIAPHRLLVSVHLGVETLDAVRQYRIRQHRDRSLLVEVVAASGFTADEARRLAESYRGLLGGLPVEVRMVDRLVTQPGGKLEVISSAAER